MADRLSQLQDAVNQMADHFCNSAGILQQCAPPGQFAGFEKSGSKPPQIAQDEYSVLFAKLIARTAKDIDVLIDSLPSEESSQELQTASIERLEYENEEAATKLEEEVKKGELLLEKIQKALSDIAQSQLQSQGMKSGN